MNCIEADTDLSVKDTKMVITFKIYNEAETKSFQITIKDDSILLQNDEGVLFLGQWDLFDALQKAFGDKMIVGME